VRVRSWPVLAASGTSGPKLREGDLQVPEGIYRINQLNPNSAYHLSLGLNYPNAADRARAALDGRSDLGSDIFIHGKDVSAGCLAIGDDAIEELFWLAAAVGMDRFTVLIVPTDLRQASPKVQGPRWLPELYRNLEAELSRFPVPQR
jgi:murein L,D-transpeptidase YafK